MRYINLHFTYLLTYVKVRITAVDRCFCANTNKKLSYRRETARQLRIYT